MAKLTLSFKGRLLAVYRLEGPPSIIGRAPDCQLVIDSLAVAPHHARITRTAEGATLTALDPAHPVFRNGQRMDQGPLADGDMILIGKHSLNLSLVEEEDAAVLSRPLPPVRPRREPPPGAPDPVPVYLQIQSGPYIGQVIALTRAVTRLKRIGGDEVIITRRGDHYVLTRIGEANRVDVGRQSLQGNAEAELTHGVQIEVDGTRCQFFFPAAGGDAGAVKAPASASEILG